MLARDVVCDSQIRGGQVISVPELKSSLLASSWTQHTAHEFRKSAEVSRFHEPGDGSALS